MPELLKQIPLGTTGISVSQVGYGTYHLADKLDEYDAVRSMGAAFDQGVTLFDTSDNYGTEGLVGIAVRQGFLPRDEVVIATKTGLGTSALNQMAWNEAGRRSDTSPERVKQQVDKSLTILGIDVIDLYQLHVYDAAVLATEQAGVMDELVEAGKIRAWGVSNYPVAALTRLIMACQENGLVLPVTSQPFLNIVEGVNGGALCAMAEGLVTLAHSPLLKGMLTDEVVSDIARMLDNEAADISKANKEWYESIRSSVGALQWLQEYAKQRGLTLAQLAVSWVASIDNTVVLSACTNDSYTQDAIKGANYQLDRVDPELLEIRSAFKDSGFVNEAIKIMRQFKYYYH